jgi:hypothetical protein
MGDLVIRAQGVGKQFRIGARQQGYRTLRDTLVDSLVAPARWVGRTLRRGSLRAENEETIWALRDVTSVHREVIHVAMAPQETPQDLRASMSPLPAGAHYRPRRVAA